MQELFEQLDFVENPRYEAIISDLLNQQYSVVDNFFTTAEVKALRESLLTRYQENTFKKAAIGNRINEKIETTIRGDYIFWLNEKQSNSAEKCFFDKINDVANYLNKTCFMGILFKEFHYALYPKGTFYKRHLDTFQNDDRRKLSVVCYLNEERWLPEYGGELVLYLSQERKETQKTIFPLSGRIVIFESQVLEHEVKTVQHKRMSITGWLKTR